MTRAGMELPARQGPSLVLRLALGLGLVGAVLWTGYTVYEVTSSRAAFLTNTGLIIDDAELNLAEVTDDLVNKTEVYRDTLVNSVLDAGEWRLANAPLSLYPNEAAKREAILAGWKSLAETRSKAARDIDRVIRERVNLDVQRRIEEMKTTRGAQAQQLVNAATRRSLTSAALVALALIVVFSVALYFTVVRPVRALTRAARGIEQGDFDRRVDVKRADEFGMLAHAFNNMVSSLQSALAEVEALNIDLERRVAEKTEALARTVEETRDANLKLEKALGDLQAAQGQLVQAEKMSAIGTLAGGVAHEFNNLLGGILGSAETALESRDLGPESREAVEMVQRTAGRASVITENLLRFARTSRDDRTPVDLESLVSDGMKLADTEARKRRVSLACVKDDLAAPVRVASEIHQVLLNLIVNAIHASPAEGTVTVGLASEGDSICITVDDEGEGIPESNRDRVFDPFFTTKEGRGTGLGLSVSYGIVKRNGGTLDFESRPGGGTRFRVRLRCEQENERDPHGKG